MGFVVLRQRRSTVQCLLVASTDAGVSAQMVRFAASLTKESIVDVEGIVTPLKEPRKDLTQLVEIRVSKIYCTNRAISTLPLNFEDAARTKAEFEAAEQKFREFLFSKNFIGIHTPKLIGGSSEGGASVFKLDYNGQPACLAQSPQLYKQMAICGGFGRVFEVGSIFRAEKSNTHRHLCEFIGLDAEMEIKEHYFEVCDIIDGLFVAIFDHLNEHCKEELKEINRQNPFEPLTYLVQTLKLTYEQGIQMLKVFSKDFYTRSRRWHAWKCIVELHLTSVAGAQHRPQAFSIIYLFYIWKKTIEYSSSVRL
ncbi:aspartate--tRNA ligase 2, cytoplasmic-like isoform X3 [Hordeum vulgare subsp. vulgare]|uniref:aspartate--tRNA ligase 2, cytoplasmic-like isoform X3 n=1 Tax=Hordeum vulgare subsp. vulgare TaxID=112509 RepID=UPI001D1A3B55|nr:aspartate--tRNA ligase 2, cytoplasmic-like isoform X3 [Hordeum vulgare subsp. vulgare]